MSKAPELPEGVPQGDVPQPLPTNLPQQNEPQYAPRAAQVACCDEPAPEPEPSRPGVDGVQPLAVVGDVVDTVTTIVSSLR